MEVSDIGMVDLRNIELESKYRKKVERIMVEIYKKNKDLLPYSEVEVNFYKDSDRVNYAFAKQVEKKAYCVKEQNCIYLSDTACEQKDTFLFEIILHELIHLTYKEMDENEVSTETQKRTDSIRSIMMRY